MSHTEQRPCPACGQPFTWTAASPRQRFCSPRCKAAWWRAITRGHAATSDVPRRRTGNDTRPDTDNVTGPGHHTGGGPSHGAVTAVQACPHCHQQIAVITWLVTPAAARVPAPAQHAVTVRDKQ